MPFCLNHNLDAKSGKKTCPEYSAEFKIDNRYVLLIFLALQVLIAWQDSFAGDYNLHHNPKSYVLSKLKIRDIVFLGTRHKQPPIPGFISDIIPKLHDAGVTHIGLEVASDQQGEINRFVETGTGLSEIQIHPQINCPEYRNLFNVLRDLDPDPDKRLVPVALDLPKSRFDGKISRDEWMAKSIAEVLSLNPDVKMLVVVGNNHILKKLDWEDHVPDPHRSIREYLSEKRANLRIFSIGQIIGGSVNECNFRKKFGGLNGAVAIDLDDRFAGWKMGIIESVAIKYAEVWELLDGVILY